MSDRNCDEKRIEANQSKDSRELGFVRKRFGVKARFTTEQSRDQATKGTGWMPWRQEPKKDVVDCEKSRGVVCRHNIREFPNGETPCDALA